MTNRNPYTIKRQLRDARREHRAEQYPGRLAADLALGRRQRRWLTRWSLVLSAAAVFALAATAVWRLGGLPAPVRPGHTVAETAPQHPTDAITDNDPTAASVDELEPNHAEQRPAFPGLTPATFARIQGRFERSAEFAELEAYATISTRWRGRSTPPQPAFSTKAFAVSPGSLRRHRLPSLTFPDGLSLPALHFSFPPRKAIS